MAQSLLPLISRKRDGGALGANDLSNFIEGVCSRQIPEYQVGAMLMAIYLRGMSHRETADLTMAMVKSGSVLDLSAIDGFKADKHSTGGVGDKVTIVLGPLVAAAGIRFPKLSGRGLGHTGGTLDKLEAIPGFRVNLSIEELTRQVQDIGLAVTGQTSELAPADGILYELRDLTATVGSIPLIASSVMCKKISAGSDGVVLDVKCGSGAFMHTREDAGELARVMVSIGEAAGMKTTAFVTSMDEPLGQAVGNALEIKEAIEVLQGNSAHEDVRDVCLLLGASLLCMAGMTASLEEGTKILAAHISSGAARGKLCQMIQAQGGDTRVVDDPSLLPQAAEVVPVPCSRRGHVRAIDAHRIGLVAMDLGAGRKARGEKVDHAVGVVLAAHLGDAVDAGQPLAWIHTNHRIPTHKAMRFISESIEVGQEPPPRRPHILEVVGQEV